MTFQQGIIIIGLVSTALPVGAVYLRGRSGRTLQLATMAAALAASIHLGILLHLVHEGPALHGMFWVRALVVSSLPMLLAGFALSVVFGRAAPRESIRDARRAFFFMIVLGGSALIFVGHPSFVTGYDWIQGKGTIHLGALGKAYLSLLLLGLVQIGYNLEKTYRTSVPESRLRMRLPLIGIFQLLAFCTLILSTGVLYSSLGIGKFIAAAVPLILMSIALAHGYTRGAITDLSAPVSRNIVYSSFTALAAALFVLAIGTAAQVATVTRWSPDEILIVTFGFLVALIAALFIFSSSFQRSVRRYVDRNFYVNRYDYRAQWSRLIQSLEGVTDRDTALSRVLPLLQEVFNAEEITIALLNSATADIRPVMGKGSKELTLDATAPLYKELARGRKTLLLDRRPDDFAYLPIYAENDQWLDETAGRMIAPLMEGETLVGTIGLGRRDMNDTFTFEDAALLDNIAAHVAAALKAMRLAQDLSESREMQLVSQWSTMLLHDMKNYLSPLRIVAENLLAYRNEPETIAVCANDIAAVSSRMEGLANALSELRCNPERGLESLCPNDLVREALTTMRVAKKESLRLELALDSKSVVRGDRQMLRRVVENLITNAVDAMEGSGTLSIRTKDLRSNGNSRVLIEVADTGGGIAPELLRDGLFRPFSTTKRKGLGLGLYQSRSIVRAHGGDLSVRSEPGKGSVFMVAMGGAPARRAATGAPAGVAASSTVLVEKRPDGPGALEFPESQESTGSPDEEDA